MSAEDNGRIYRKAPDALDQVVPKDVRGLLERAFLEYQERFKEVMDIIGEKGNPAFFERDTDEQYQKAAREVDQPMLFAFDKYDDLKARIGNKPDFSEFYKDFIKTCEKLRRCERARSGLTLPPISLLQQIRMETSSACNALQDCNIVEAKTAKAKAVKENASEERRCNNT